MKKEELNLLRVFTQGEISDETLRTAKDLKVEGNTISFKIMAKPDFKAWQWHFGTAQKEKIYFSDVKDKPEW